MYALFRILTQLGNFLLSFVPWFVSILINCEMIPPSPSGSTTKYFIKDTQFNLIFLFISHAHTHSVTHPNIMARTRTATTTTIYIWVESMGVSTIPYSLPMLILFISRRMFVWCKYYIYAKHRFQGRFEPSDIRFLVRQKRVGRALFHKKPQNRCNQMHEKKNVFHFKFCCCCVLLCFICWNLLSPLLVIWDRCYDMGIVFRISFMLPRSMFLTFGLKLPLTIQCLPYAFTSIWEYRPVPGVKFTKILSYFERWSWHGTQVTRCYVERYQTNTKHG